MEKGKFRLASRVLLSACAAIALVPAVAHAQMGNRIQYHIQAQDLGTALTELARQSKAEIYFSSDLTRGRRAPPVSGQLSVEQALDRILEGSGLSYRINPDGAIVIVSAEGNARSAAEAPAKITAGPNSELHQQIVVTGTRIRGVTPASPVLVVNRADIDRSGDSNLGAVMRSIPENFSGGQNPGVVGAPGNTQFSISGGSSPNLRGLGADSTLTLVDGHRLAYDAYQNDVDISMVPLAAVDHVDILLDGASALYGSDAVAGVVNVILRKDFDGFETNANIGGSTAGGAAEQTFNQLAGAVWKGGNVLADYEHSHNDGLYTSERSYSASAASPQTLLPVQSRDSFFGTVNQSISDNVTIFAEGLYTSRSSDEVFSVSGNRDLALVDVKQYGITSGVNISLPFRWHVSFDGTYSRDEDDERTPVYSLSTGALIRSGRSAYVNRLASMEVDADGPLFTLPSGDLRAAIGVGYRSERFVNESSAGTSAKRTIKYAYGEIDLPVVPPSQSRRGLEKLEVDGAVRYEQYSDVGTVTKPKLGILYRPTRDLQLRATWAESFRAPELLDEYGPRQLYLAPSAAFVGGSPAPATVLFTNGSNPNLKPETADTRTVGFDYSPQWDKNLRLSATLYDIRYKQRIVQPITNILTALSNPIYGSFVTQNPTLALQQQLVESSPIFANFTGAPYEPDQVVDLIENEYANAAREDISGLDIIVTYLLVTPIGSIDVSGNASWLRVKQQLLPEVAWQKLSGTIFNPPDFKAKASITWQRDDWSVTGTVNHIDGEVDTNFTPPRQVASWTTVDGQIAYTHQIGRSLLKRVRATLSVQNLFDRPPPPIAVTSTVYPGIGFDSTNASALGRFISGAISFQW